MEDINQFGTNHHSSVLCLLFKSSTSGGDFQCPVAEISVMHYFSTGLFSLSKIRGVHFSFVMEHLEFVRVNWSGNILLVNVNSCIVRRKEEEFVVMTFQFCFLRKLQWNSEGHFVLVM